MIKLFLFSIPSIFACSVYLQSNSIKYLSTTQLQLFKISDTCTTTCADGYYGEFCQDLNKYYNIPMGPWNQAGYFTRGGLLRSMTLDVSNIYSIQYTKRDSVLVGIYNAGFINSVVSEISLYGRTITPILYATPSGTLDALVVRKGVVYVARAVSGVGYDIATLESTQISNLLTIQTKAVLIEVCTDKGTVTYFVYGSGKVSAYYPSGAYTPWITIGTITGMISGPDCQTLYASSNSNIIRINSAGYTTLKATSSTIYCLTGVPEINVLIYKSKSNMWQINLGTGSTSSIPLGITQTQEVVCSSDVSEQNNQILIVQNGVIRTLEAIQEPCPFGQTSPPLLCNSSSQCVDCPPLPSNSYRMEGSVECGWLCQLGYKRVGSKCIGQVIPCPSNYRGPGCTPSVLPWADQGMYVTTKGFSSQLSLPTKSPLYLLTMEGSVILVVPGQFFLSDGIGWTPLTLTFSASSCSYSDQNSYYYLSSRQGILWVAFTMQRVEGTQHCLWAVSTNPLKVIQSWALNSQICSATGDGGGVYAIFCGYNYISYAKLQSGSILSPVIGSPTAGYTDGVFQAARLNGPSSLVAHDNRLYITDTGNCVIREVDLIRGVVGTVAGMAGICQRVDGVESALASPTNLVNTPYDGFFLFTDGNIIRQFHSYTSTVNTILTNPFRYSQITGITATYSGILVQSQGSYYIYNASFGYCPAGSSSLAGSANDASECVPCQAFHYSNVSCKPCSAPVCTLPGQLFVPCRLDADAYCGSCTNKPQNFTKYIGASSIPTPGNCEWIYIPPCPAGYYKSGDVCTGCPMWSTSPIGSTSNSSCRCLGGVGILNCVVASPFAVFPALCGPLEVCQAYEEPVSLFPVISCIEDTYLGVCQCEAGEYIQQIYPKICTRCPAGLYSPDGKGCRVCPYLTEPSSFQSSCKCAAGTIDIGLFDPICVCGPGTIFSAVGCVPCPMNTYQGDGTCIPCPLGMWSPASATVCTKCPLGQFRQFDDCQSCPKGMYAPEPGPCLECVVDCNGKRETLCPTDDSLFMCSDCPLPRAHATSSGRDCATACNNGFYELDGACVACAQITCPIGDRLVECTPYADAGCVECVNTSMPLNFAVWSHNTKCEWQCEVGYFIHEGGCIKAGVWSMWDLFTL